MILDESPKTSVTPREMKCQEYASRIQSYQLRVCGQHIEMYNYICLKLDLYDKKNLQIY